ncbi:ABC transporter substrate-binding protein [Mycoplasma marinum]|uniref:Solute-binding protein family 5 domain-containing protein n=1 Tax=Mycoplasma marinum TaxID=1937190 RepID=A0A4V2NI09_9MOLU|nr:ABC transporter substrate-binding protein [Mycoplasma marinum]TCG11008.1 hypothetical protein C4B24_03220 [Mycoplasma marinum]
MLKKIFRKVMVPILGTSIGISILPIALFVSNKYSHKDKYDFGLAVPTVNSLNYIKYDGPTSLVASSLIEGFFFSGPTGDLKNQMQIPSFDGVLFAVKNGKASASGQSYPLSNYGYTSSTITLGPNAESFVSVVDDQNLVHDVFLHLNRKSRWRSGDKKWDQKYSRLVKGSDYVDSAKAILNLQNGSQKLSNLKDMHIKGVNDVYNAQFEYYKKNKKIYPTPFDGKLKKDGTIGESKFKLGVSSGKTTLENEKIMGTSQTAFQLAESLVPKNERDKKGEWADYIVHYSLQTPVEYFTLFSKMLKSDFLPINKKFIDDHGGIRHFGDSIKNFIWNGPFDIDSLILGQQGSLTLKKSNKYFDEKNVIPNSIKLYFQEDEVVKGALFDDGKISYTKVPSIYQMKFWSDPNKRRYMHKNAGFGTIALSLNLDKNTNGDSPLQDENLRKAISYGINREKILKYAGWQSSFPVVTWTGFGNAKDTKSRHIESHWGIYKNTKKQWDGEVYKTENGKTFPIQNINWFEHEIKSHSFENSNRKDSGFDPETAKYFLEKYKKSHPNKERVTLRYVDSGTPESRKVFIGLQNFLKEQFGDYLKLEEKTLPQNVFVQYQTTGNYDIIYGNFDKYGTELSSYIKRFVLPDGIDKKAFKTTGFRENPAGSWTYTDFKIKRQKANTWKILQSQLKIPQDVWDKMNELIPDKIPKKQEEKQKIMDKFEGFFIDRDGKNEDSFIVKTAAGFEKLIRESTPIIPLMEVDNYWSISRLMGNNSMQTLTLKFAYDVNNKPRPNLPGLEKE